MKNFNTILNSALVTIAEFGLPKFSGRQKVLEVLIKIHYSKNVFKHLKVVFWCPNNYMLVGYDLETHVEDMSQEFTVTASHDSTWKYDGLNFLSEIVKNSEDIEILTIKMIEVSEAGLNTNEDFYYIKAKSV